MHSQVVEDLRLARPELEEPQIDDEALFYEFFIDPPGRDSGFSFKAPVTAKYDDGKTILYQGKFSSHKLVSLLLLQ